MLTSFYLSLLALVFVRISLDTINARRRAKVSLGPGANDEILGYVSAHSNFQSYVPIIGLLMYFYENSELFNELALHAIGLTVLAGRLVHYIGVRNARAQNFKFRVAGMQMTIWPLIVLTLLNLANFAYVTRIKG